MPCKHLVLCHLPFLPPSIFPSISLVQFSSLSRVRLFATPWTTAHQASLSITNSRSPPKPMSIESVMPSNHLILCHPLLLQPSIFPSIRVFSNESALCIRWPKYWSFSFNISPSNEHPGLISFRMDWLDLPAVQGTLKSHLQHHTSKASILRCSAFFIVQLSHPYMTTGKTIALTRWTFVKKVMSLLSNMLSSLVITFLPRSKRLLISWLKSVLPMNIQDWFLLRLTGFYLLAVQETLKNLLQHHSSKVSILQSLAFFRSNSHICTWLPKKIALTICTFVSKVMSLLFNMLCRFFIAFLSRSKHLLISWLQLPSSVIILLNCINDFPQCNLPKTCNILLRTFVHSSRVPIRLKQTNKQKIYICIKFYRYMCLLLS